MGRVACEWTRCNLRLLVLFNLNQQIGNYVGFEDVQLIIVEGGVLDYL